MYQSINFFERRMKSLKPVPYHIKDTATYLHSKKIFERMQVSRIQPASNQMALKTVDRG